MPRDLTACLDQLHAALADVATVLGGYRDQLIAAGFDDADALELCLDVQREMICRSMAGE